MADVFQRKTNQGILDTINVIYIPQQFTAKEKIKYLWPFGKIELEEFPILTIPKKPFYLIGGQFLIGPCGDSFDAEIADFNSF